MARFLMLLALFALVGCTVDDSRRVVSAPGSPDSAHMIVPYAVDPVNGVACYRVNVTYGGTLSCVKVR